MDTSIMDITFVHDDESNDNAFTTPFHNRLNFSMLLSSDPPTAITSPINCKKRKRSNSNNSSSSDPNQTTITPPNKKPRISSIKSSSTSTLNPIDENSVTFQLQSNPNTVNSNSSNDQKPRKKKKKPKKSKSKSKSKSISQQPLRRSARLRNKQNKQKIQEIQSIESVKSTKTNSSNDNDTSPSNDSLASISLPLSALRINNNKSTSNEDIDIEHNENNSNHNKKTRVRIECDKNEIRERSISAISTSSEWDEIFPSNITTSKWNAKATPIKSSLKITKHKKRIDSISESSKKVNWGQVNITKFEQRCGIFSCAVPTEHGPSLHLGKFISQKTSKIDNYEEQKKTGKSWNGELNKRQRMNRVKQFSPKDLNKERMKEDLSEIKRLRKSREEVGCNCVSIYKMRKDQIIGRIIYIKSNEIHGKDMDKKEERKRLNKMKKNQVMEELMKIQFEKYGRYDVCCVDDTCLCFKEGIECQIDSDCCKCGGDRIYNNYLREKEDGIGDENDDGNKDKNKKSKKDKRKNKLNKRDSLCCGNKWGNTLGVTIWDYIDKNGEFEEHDVRKIVESSFLSFKSQLCQKRINDWNEHYDDVDDIENKENHNSEIRKSLKFENE